MRTKRNYGLPALNDVGNAFAFIIYPPGWVVNGR
jgi:hypothetical protein